MLKDFQHVMESPQFCSPERPKVDEPRVVCSPDRFREASRSFGVQDMAAPTCVQGKNVEAVRI